MIRIYFFEVTTFRMAWSGPKQPKEAPQDAEIDDNAANPCYVLIHPLIAITIVDLGPLRPQINKIIVDFGIRGASWGVLAPPGRSSNSDNRSNHYFNTKLG